MPYSCKIRFSEIVCGCCLIFFCWINGLFAADATLDLKTLRSQAESGNKTAQFHLANRYFYGQDNCPVNRELAVYWFRKAAEQGVPEAQYNYALCLEQGIGINRNIPEAMKYYRLSAANLFVPAMYRQAVLMMKGPALSAAEEKKLTPENRKAINNIMDPPAGLALLKQLADKYKMPEAQVDLAEYLIKNLPQNAEEKIKTGKKIYALLIRAKKQNPQGKNAVIYRLLADCMFGGYGVKINEKKAVDYLKKAVDAGDDEAMVKLAYCIEKGVTSPPDSKKAFELYRKAAEKGFPYAQYKYGNYIAAGYENGKGLEEAIRWYILQQFG